MADSLYEALNIVSNGTDENSIVPGTTPRLILTVKDSEVIKKTKSVRIDVNQGGKTILQILKTEIKDSQVIYTFTQEETYQMLPGSIEVQYHGLTDDDLAWKTDIFKITIAKTLSNTIIGQPMVVMNTN